MTSRTYIKNTETFKQSHRVIQQILLSKTNVISIKKGIKMACEIGIENWQMKTSSGTNNQEIIKELFILKTNKSGRTNRKIKIKSGKI